MGVTSGRVYQEVGVANGWNLWVWLVSVVVASGASYLVCSMPALSIYIYIY